MKNKVIYFPIGTVDMSLVQLANGYTILIDCFFLGKASDTCHVSVDELLERLPEDDKGRPYVDVFIWLGAEVVVQKLPCTWVNLDLGISI